MVLATRRLVSLSHKKALQQIPTSSRGVSLGLCRICESISKSMQKKNSLGKRTGVDKAEVIRSGQSKIRESSPKAYMHYLCILLLPLSLQPCNQ